MSEDAITFKASVYKVQTLVDGGVRVTLDLPETAILPMAQLADCQRRGIVLQVTAEACQTNGMQAEEDSNYGKVGKRAIRKSAWITP